VRSGGYRHTGLHCRHEVEVWFSLDISGLLVASPLDLLPCHALTERRTRFQKHFVVVGSLYKMKARGQSLQLAKILALCTHCIISRVTTKAYRVCTLRDPVQQAKQSREVRKRQEKTTSREQQVSRRPHTSAYLRKPYKFSCR